MVLSNLLEGFKDSKYYLLILVASTYGLRLGEILVLTWGSVDFKSQTLTINKQCKQVGLNKYDFGTLKS
ncbi:hypothetical protein [Clostridium sp. UBA4548]|uniref:hypothetical protein n=1 Tax=Clostridium sp. UBA4548 TaxID=1946361 RepID=UPI0025C5A514|nr:hypothetical protein [Clostridium sp. UBA4548]